MGSTDLDAIKGIPKQNSVCVCLKERDSLKGIHYSISFLFCPDPLIGICMILHPCVVYCTNDLRCKKQYICCCFLSLFCRQTSGNPQKLKSLKPATQTLLNVFCCVLASRFLHSPDWRRIMQLCYQRHTIWLLFISCFPVRSSLHAFLFLLSKIRQNCTVHSKDRWCTYVGLKVAWKN